jgi:hypothetical protein
MQHPEEGLIHAWLDGALPSNEAAALESHVATCKECEARVAEARGLIAASSRIVGHLDAVPGKVIPAMTPKRRLPSWRSPWVAAIAAGLILVVRGYVNWPGEADVRELADVSLKGVAAADSSIVIQPPPPVAPRTGASEQAPAKKVADAPASVSLPPANAAAQKTTIAAAAPTAAAMPPAKIASVQAAEARGDARAPERRLAEIVTATGAMAGKATAAAAPSMVASQARDMASVDSPRAFIGCYEMNSSTGILPARFALTSDSSAIPGLQRVQYVDAEGKAISSISDLGWAIEGGQVVVKTLAQETLLTLRKTGSAVAGESRSGPRNGRVTSCK